MFVPDVTVTTPIHFNNAIDDLKLHVISLNAIRKTGNYMHQLLNIIYIYIFIYVFTYLHHGAESFLRS